MSSQLSAQAEDRYVDGPLGERFHYRRFGTGGDVPLVLCMVMINSYATSAMSQKLPDAKVVLYGDAGHGFLFQHVEDFADDVHRFLR